MKRKKRRSRTKADIITGVLYVIFGTIVLAVLYGAGRLAYLVMGTTIGNHYYAALAEKTVVDDRVDFSALSAENPEIYAWVRVDDAAISLPVVKTTDNAYYLTHRFDETKNKLGTPFIDTGNTGDFSDRHTLIYGHALKSGAMFGFLWEYENPNYVSRHPQILLDLADGRRLTLNVFACSRMEGVRSAIPISFETEASFLSFIDDLHETSAFFNNVKLSSEDRIVSFCVVPPNGGEGLMLVSCRIADESTPTVSTGTAVQEISGETPTE